MGRRLASLLLVALLVTALVPAWAIADGDPASDVLLGENVFYPYMPPVPQAIQDRLNGETIAAKKAGFPIKVALIASPTDLGAIPELFGKPQEYATFLDREISFVGKQPVLVVMAAGYGIQGVDAAVGQSLRALPAPGKTSRDLAESAIAAVPKLAAAAGHRFRSAPSRSGGSGSSRTLLLSILIAAAVVVALLLLALRSRDLLVATRAQRQSRRRG